MRILFVIIQVISFFFLFLIILCLFNIPLFISFLYNKIEIALYLKDGISPSAYEALVKRIDKLRDGIEIKYKSKEEALKEIIPPKIANTIDKNPLSDTCKIRLFGKIEACDFENLVEAIKKNEEIERISYPKNDVIFLKRIKDILLKGVFLIGIIYLVGVIIILSIFSGAYVKIKEDEREILYLSGTTKSSLSLSLIISSIIESLIASGFAIFFLFLGYRFLPNTFFGFEISFFPLDIILSLLGISMLIGFITKIPSILFI